ncbi:MAG TPA: hypothetical protein VMT22_23995 [Terriglobales bacterium]|nr:hypothetical protein [Terriglobales bacterium]
MINLLAMRGLIRCDQAFEAMRRPSISITFLITLFAVVAVCNPETGAALSKADSPFAVASFYLKAAQAHDFEAAYSYISSADRQIQNKSSYVRSQVSFNGFALELARRLTAGMEIWPIEQRIEGKNARLEIGYRTPTGEELSSRLWDWNPEKLNQLSPAEQTTLIEAVETLKKNQRRILLEGRESVDLVLQQDGWKVYFDWKSRARVNFATPPSSSKELAVRFLRNDFLVKTDEPFQVDFRITNRTNREINTRLNHRFEPRRWADNIDMIACGLLAPLRLGPNETRDLSSAYLLRGKIPAGTSVKIIYDFASEPSPEKRSPAS